MLRYILWGALLAALYPHTAAAQVLTVQDADTREPLVGVAVFSADFAVFTTTNEKGRANLEAFTGQDSIAFRHIGYAEKVLSYDQLAGQYFEVLLEADRLTLREVVVSGNRWEQDNLDVPARIEQVSSQEVAFRNPQTAADLLGLSNHVYIQKSQLGGGSPMLRGFATNRVLLVVDGVRMNTAIFRSGNLQNVISLDAQSIENTEVLFGSSSVIYGSDAIGGVMDFHTLRPDLSVTGKPEFTGAASARYSSASNERTGHVDFNLGLRRWAFTTSVTYSDYDDLRMGADGPDDYLRPVFQTRIDDLDTVLRNDDPRLQRSTGFNQLNLMQKVRFQPADDWDLSYAFHYSESSDLPRYDRLIETRNGALRNAEWYYGPQKWRMHHFAATYRRPNALFDQARLTAAYQFFEESRNDRRFGEEHLRQRTEQVDALSLNLDFDKRFGERTSLFYGLEAIRNDIGSAAVSTNITTGERAPTSTRYPDGSTWQSYAAYASLRYYATEALTLNAGVRYNAFQVEAPFDTTFFPFPFTEAEISDDAITANLGLVYHPNERWIAYANLSTGFRAPNIDDIGKLFDSEPGAVIVPNPNLRSEYAYNGEVGFAVTAGRWAKFDLSAFYTVLDDALARRPFRFNGQDSIVYDGTLSRVLALQNVSQARVWGVQASVETDLGGGLGLSSFFNYQWGEEQDEETGENIPLRHAAPPFGSTHLTYVRRGLKLDLYAEYNGALEFADLAPSEREKTDIYALDENGNPYAPAWWTLNVKGAYRLGDRLSLTAGVENLLDKRYRPYSSGIAAPGRNVIVALRITW